MRDRVGEAQHGRDPGVRLQQRAERGITVLLGGVWLFDHHRLDACGGEAVAPTEHPLNRDKYEQAALKMLDALVRPEYLASETPGWEGILKHGVYHTKKNIGVDESVMWGEYFFVEALTKVVANQFQRLSPDALAQNRERYARLS